MKNNSARWAELEGGYKTPYDLSIPIMELEQSTSEKQIQSIFKDLWQNLHHQGDVGLASYCAVPELIDICIAKNSFDWNFIGLCIVIEHCRIAGNNPSLPEEFKNDYFDSLQRFESYLLKNFKEIHEENAIQLSLALFATLNGQIELGKTIVNLDKDIINELSEKYGW
jgi:hypothetical protein